MFVTVNITQEIQSTFYKYIYMNASLDICSSLSKANVHVTTFQQWIISDEKEARVLKKQKDCSANSH